MIIDTTNKILSLGTIGAQVFIVLALIYWFFFKEQNNSLVRFFSNNGLVLAFLVALVSVGSSLFYSEIAGFPPCDLCWVQRVFMYPLVVILALALIKKDVRASMGISPKGKKFTLVGGSLWLAGLGFLVSAYHNYMYYSDGGLNVLCQFGSMEVSCVKRYVFEFGYVTIPLMALTAFTLIEVLLFLYRTRKEAQVQ